jgi:hypothetical protein
MSKKQNTIIFGAGGAGRAAFQNLNRDYQIIAFTDNDQDKVGEMVCGIPIVSPSLLSSIAFDKIFIASEYYEQISQQLDSVYNVAKSKIHCLAANDIKGLRFGDSRSVEVNSECVLFQLCKTLRQLGIKHHIDAGTLLGIYRDGALIPWDDDLDIAIPSEEVTKIKYAQGLITDDLRRISGSKWVINEYLSNVQFGLVSQGDVRSFKLSVQAKNTQFPMIDLFIKYSEAEQMDYVISSRGFSMPSRHMATLDILEYKNQLLSIPSDVEGYLAGHYGDWETPKKDWSLQDIQSATVF